MSAGANEADFINLLFWLTEHIGLRFREDQHSNTKTTIRRLMNRFQISEFAELQLALQQRPQLLSELIDQLTVGETYFFREHQHFDFIRQTILPEIRSRRGQTHQIRVWSAGCASGEEAYSMAIVFKQEKIWPAPTILATDLSVAALDKARGAEFRHWSFRGEASAAVKEYVTESADRFTLSQEIRNRVQFRRLNLAEKNYPSPTTGTRELDLILCRNVLIYFGPETIRDISRRLLQCLAPGGWLVTASGDPRLEEHADFEVVRSGQGYFYRRPLTLASSAAKTAQKTSRPSSNAESQILERQPPSAVAESVSADFPAEDAAQASFGPNMLDDPSACLIHIKEVALNDPNRALEICRVSAERHPLVEELHYWHGVLLADAARTLDALQSLRKAIFLNRSSVMSHFLFASIQLRQGQYDAARKHFRRVCELCAAGNPHDVLPMSGGETVVDIAVAAASQLARIESEQDP